MLSRPEHGWTDFQLEGTSVHALSYLDGIPFEWLDQAIAGLATGKPFCVRGSLEPGEFACTVSRDGCRIALTGPGGCEASPVGMLDFCKALHRDVRQYAAEWAVFAAGIAHRAEDASDRLPQLKRKLDQLQSAIKRAGKFL